MKHTLTLPIHTTHLNAMMGRHWRKIARLKKADREAVGLCAMAQGVPAAAGKRRVSLAVVYGRGGKRPDEDGWEKSLLDAMVCAGLLVDDSQEWVQFVRPVEYKRGPRRGMVVTLEDIADG